MKTTLEDITTEEFDKLPTGSAVKSKDGKMVVIKRELYWEILCLANRKPENPDSRYLCVVYNEIYLEKIFGRAVNSYTNFITAGDVIARHFHKKIKEIFRVESLESSLIVTLENPDTKQRTEIELSGKLVDFDGQKYLREIVILEGVAHKVSNPNESITAISVTTSGQHEDDDVFAYEM